MRSHAKSITLAICAVLTSAGIARSYENKVLLLGDAQVQAGAIYLSDLLPARTPDTMRLPALKLLIGAAPPPGSTRILEGAKVEELLGGDNAFRSIEVPRQIVVHRGGRAVTRDEIIAAIRSALISKGFSADQVQPEDLNFSSTVMLTGAADAQLGVTRMDFDSGLQQVRFLLKSRADNAMLPFLATAPIRSNAPMAVPSLRVEPGEIPASDDMHKESQTANSARPISNALVEQLAGKRANAALGSGAALRVAEYGSAPMVQAGKMASLSVSSSSMQMLLTVVPLERGAMGQTIRVKLPGNGTVLRANVVGVGRLEARF